MSPEMLMFKRMPISPSQSLFFIIIPPMELEIIMLEGMAVPFIE